MLLTYIALMRRARTSELLAMFWPEEPLPEADRGLRKVMADITRCVGLAWVARTAGHWEARECLDSDVSLFRQACTCGEYARAVQEYSGPFLRGGPIAVTERFRDWAMTIRAETSHRHMLVSHRLALLRTADAMGHGVAFTDREAQVIAANRTFRTWVSATPELGDALRTWVAAVRWPALADAAEPLRVRLSAGGLLFDAVGEVVASETADAPARLLQLRPAATIEAGEACAAGGGIQLTDAQRRVARLLAMGLGNAEIAARLGLSSHTVRHHTEQVLAKLGLRSRAGVAAALSGIRCDGAGGRAAGE